MTGRFLGALQFLTVLPVRGPSASSGDSAIFFPLIGALLGASAGMVSLTSHRFGALFALTWLIAFTGCLHEDGLADVADAIRAGRSRERMLSILKDSRIGVYGATALIVSFAFRWQTLASGMPSPIASLATICALSRSSLVIVASVTPTVGNSMANEFAAGCSRAVLGLTLCQVALIAAISSWYIGWQLSLVLLGMTLAICSLAKIYFTKRLGGVNGDCLGATCQVVEIAGLMTVAWA